MPVDSETPSTLEILQKIELTHNIKNHTDPDGLTAETGSSGADSFTLVTGGRSTIITEFEPEYDNLLINGEILNPNTSDDRVSIEQAGNNVTVTLETSEMVILQDADLEIWRNFADVSDGIVEGTESADLIDRSFADGGGDSVQEDSAVSDTVYGHGGDDRIHLYNGNDIAYGGEGNDVIYGQMGNNSLYGGAGNDFLHSGDYSSILNGGDGDDELRAKLLKGGDHILTGAAGADLFVFEANKATNSSILEITVYEVGIDRLTIEGFDIENLE
ncbi:calcium-binding protein [Phaeobacter piscinae]|uniref:calcium-binding protein n=1 Tax=Phaeobacter piscinae TaxID=1580596 RepID=UPI000C99F70B|nr:hypothetical protein [Phaeobacter piscinae]AUQ73763.1 Hemolysin-type calcium-binding protein repeat protein (2 copies) [Phaeobacter piscinae]